MRGESKCLVATVLSFLTSYKNNWNLALKGVTVSVSGKTCFFYLAPAIRLKIKLEEFQIDQKYFTK